MAKENKEAKNKRKQEEKRIKELKSVLDWIEVQKISDEGIYLQKNNVRKIVKGIKVEPYNILLCDEHRKARNIISFANGLDACSKFQIFYKFIKSEPDLMYQINLLSKRLSEEKNGGIRAILKLQLHKMDWFTENHNELCFYTLVQEDENVIDKVLEKVKQIYVGTDLKVTTMTKKDYESVVKEQFENDTVNEYMFSCLLKDEEVYESEVK